MRVRRILLTGLVLSALGFTPALAQLGVPSPPNSTFPSQINLMGVTGGVVDPFGTFTVVVRDIANNPVPGAFVEVDFSACPEIGLGQVIAVDALTCPSRVSTTADGNGVATFDIGGFIYACSPCVGTNQCTVIRANTIPLGIVAVGAFDLDGTSGVGPSDISRWLLDFSSGCFIERSDYDGSGGVGGNDLSFMLARIGSGRDIQSASHCDGLLNTQSIVTGGAVNLHWTDCVPGGGTSTRNFACNTNAGSETMVGSVSLPGPAPDVTGFTAEVVVQTNNALLSAWWNFTSTGCRSTSLSQNLDFTSGPFGCVDLWSANAVGGVVSVVTPDGTYLNRARIKLVGALAVPVAMAATTEYSLFKLVVSHTKTTGAVVCAGCADPACILLEQVVISQLQDLGCPGGAIRPNFKVTNPGAGSVVSWQTTAQVCQGATPTHRDTWGHIKSLYR